jgi:hypothetical protein
MCDGQGIQRESGLGAIEGGSRPSIDEIVGVYRTQSGGEIKAGSGRVLTGRIRSGYSVVASGDIVENARAVGRDRASFRRVLRLSCGKLVKDVVCQSHATANFLVNECHDAGKRWRRG